MVPLRARRHHHATRSRSASPNVAGDRVAKRHTQRTPWQLRRLATIAQQLPGKSIGSPEQVAHAVLLLMTNRFMNGEILHIDGAGRHV